MLMPLAVACIAVPLMCIVKVCARIISQDWDNPVAALPAWVGALGARPLTPKKIKH